MARYKVDITGINTNELKVITGDETIKLFERYGWFVSSRSYRTY